MRMPTVAEAAVIALAHRGGREAAMREMRAAEAKHEAQETAYHAPDYSMATHTSWGSLIKDVVVGLSKAFFWVCMVAPSVVYCLYRLAKWHWGF